MDETWMSAVGVVGMHGLIKVSNPFSDPPALAVLSFRTRDLPRPQGSKRPVGRRKNGSTILVEESDVKPWRQAVRSDAREAMRGAPPWAVPVCADLTFVMPRPKSGPRSAPGGPYDSAPDVDKLCRAVLDALSGVAYDDDRRVVDLRARKRVQGAIRGPDEEVSVYVTVWPYVRRSFGED